MVIVPCSGIGKTYGTVSREAAYGHRRPAPETTQLVALSMLVLGDEAAVAWSRRTRPSPSTAASWPAPPRWSRRAAGACCQDFAVLDVYRRYKEFKPQGIAELNEGGLQLAQALAEEVRVVDRRCSISRQRKEARMPELPKKKVGIVSCSGEELAEGTVTRLAALKVLEQLRPADTVTICLPLFLAGGEGDRAFAKFYPTIAVDGCELRCAARATEMYSGKPAASIVVTEGDREQALGKPEGQRRLNAAGLQPWRPPPSRKPDRWMSCSERTWNRRTGEFMEPGEIPLHGPDASRNR